MGGDDWSDGDCTFGEGGNASVISRRAAYHTCVRTTIVWCVTVRRRMPYHHVHHHWIIVMCAQLIAPTLWWCFIAYASTIFCSLYQNLALHRESMESEVFSEWTDVIVCSLYETLTLYWFYRVRFSSIEQTIPGAGIFFCNPRFPPSIGRNQGWPCEIPTSAQGLEFSVINVLLELTDLKTGAGILC